MTEHGQRLAAAGEGWRFAADGPRVARRQLTDFAILALEAAGRDP